VISDICSFVEAFRDFVGGFFFPSPIVDARFVLDLELLGLVVAAADAVRRGPNNPASISLSVSAAFMLGMRVGIAAFVGQSLAQCPEELDDGRA